MRLLAIIGSRKLGNTDIMVKKYLEIMQEKYPEAEYKIVNLHDYTVKPCISCKSCLLHGEEFCPLDDDTKSLFDEINNCDGIIVSSPNFVSNVSGIMKLFIDRLAYLGHRPRFFDKWVYPLVTSAGPGGAKECLKALTYLWEYSGFNVMKGTFILTPPYRRVEDVICEKRDLLEKEANNFYKCINEKVIKQPSLHMLMTYNFYKAISRSKPDLMKKTYKCDFKYYTENGWLEKQKQYFDDRRLGLVQKIMSKAFYLIFSVVSKYGFNKFSPMETEDIINHQ